MPHFDPNPRAIAPSPLAQRWTALLERPARPKPAGAPVRAFEDEEAAQLIRQGLTVTADHLMQALRRGWLRTMDACWERGPRVAWLKHQNDEGQNLLHVLAEVPDALLHHRPDGAAQLRQKWANLLLRDRTQTMRMPQPSLVNAVDNEGQTPLMVAARHNHQGLSGVLFDYGAWPHAVDVEGRHFLHHWAAGIAERHPLHGTEAPRTDSHPFDTTEDDEIAWADVGRSRWREENVVVQMWRNPDAHGQTPGHLLLNAHSRWVERGLERLDRWENLPEGGVLGFLLREQLGWVALRDHHPDVVEKLFRAHGDPVQALDGRPDRYGNTWVHALAANPHLEQYLERWPELNQPQLWHVRNRDGKSPQDVAWEARPSPTERARLSRLPPFQAPEENPVIRSAVRMGMGG